MSAYLEMRGIQKTYRSFGREVHALKGVDFSVQKGTVHGLLGENGAGKSTLMKILSGVERMDEGEIRIGGSLVRIKNAITAAHCGVGMVHQHFSLLDDYTVVENVVLGMEPVKALGFVDERAARKAAEEAAKQCGFSIELDRKVATLSMGEKQKVEIMRALFGKADLLVFDEPTSVLVEQEVRGLLETIRMLKASGKTIVYISHKVEEVLAITDEVTVLRDGEAVFTGKTSALDAQETVRLMVGKTLSPELDRSACRPGACVLDVKDLYVKNGPLFMVKGANFCVSAGEIVGIAGVNGNGQQELLEALFGLRESSSGAISLLGKEISHFSPCARRKAGMGYIPEDRIHVGSCATASVSENLLIDRRNQKPFCHAGWLDPRPLEQLSSELIERFSIKASDGRHIVGGLSGGHIQRTILARELTAEPKLLLAAEVTMGLDVLSARYIHDEMLALREKGLAILLVSSNINEILELSDRVLVLRGGEITACLENTSALTREEIGEYMLGVKRMEPETGAAQEAMA
ncbi:MAG TPA: ABC transporter ATP-binding protein [Feifaniaceae bacterium]|nr:ABC transporter ATP-binding protein [Feifaniaceae bacterium]